MHLQKFRKQFIYEELGITEDYGKIFSFIDFSNVNKWFDKDNQDWRNKLIAKDEKIKIDLEKFKSFTNVFSNMVRIYYGEDPKNVG